MNTDWNIDVERAGHLVGFMEAAIEVFNARLAETECLLRTLPDAASAENAKGILVLQKIEAELRQLQDNHRVMVESLGAGLQNDPELSKQFAYTVALSRQRVLAMAPQASTGLTRAH